MQYTVICCIVWQAGRPTPSGDLLCAQEHVGKKTKALRKQVNNGVRRSYFMCICYFKDFLHSWVHIYIIEWLCQFLVCGWLINFMYFWPVSTVLLLALTVVLFICLLVEDEFLLWSLIATRELLWVGFTWFSTKKTVTQNFVHCIWDIPCRFCHTWSPGLVEYIRVFPFSDWVS